MAALPTYASLRMRGHPNGLLVDAVSRLGAQRGLALDVGAGPLNDARYLLRAGFEVHAIDTDEQTTSLAAKIDDARLHVVRADVRDAPIAPGTYAIVVAIHVLPFLPRPDVPAVMDSLAGALTRGGILCCTFLGQDDGWAGRRPHMTFLAQREIETLLCGLETIELSERRYDGRNASGEPKRWHVVRCLARKVEATSASPRTDDQASAVGPPR
jgi:SAM-dependent methyltransferase